MVTLVAMLIMLSYSQTTFSEHKATSERTKTSRSLSDHFRAHIPSIPEVVPVEKVTLPSQCASGYVIPTTSFDFWSLSGSLFNASGYTTYITNVLTGLRLTYYFQYSTECTKSVQNLLSDIYLGNKIY